jgi:amino acid transporter
VHSGPDERSSGVVSTLFAIAALTFVHGTTALIFVVLTVAVSTLLISYLLIVPAIVKLRRNFPDVGRPYRVPGGTTGSYVLAAVVLGFIASGSWVAIFPEPSSDSSVSSTSFEEE